ncbi:MAG: hypothetical protein KAQ98_02130 [Bacteriovoracaceae bacterium]|nr:hypothetical protein [Bacteriovoracaceae bacterium]
MADSNTPKTTKDIYVDAQQLFLVNKFDQSAKDFQKCLEDVELAEDMRASCYEYLLKIYAFLGMRKDLEDARKGFVDILKKCNQFDRAHEIIEAIIKENVSIVGSKLLEDLWNSLIGDGKIKRSKEIAGYTLNYYWRRKLIHRAKSFLEMYGNKCAKDVFYRKWLIKFMVLAEDWNELDEFIDSLFCDFNKSGFEIWQRLPEEIIQYLEMEVEKWFYSKRICELKILLRMNRIINEENKNGHLKVREEIINIIYEYLLRFGEIERVLIFLLDYCVYFGKKKMLAKIKEMSDSGPLDCPNYHNIKSMVEQVFKKIDEIKSSDEEMISVEIGSIDLGEDLFLVETDSERETRVRKLERDIVFLNKTGKKEEVDKRLVELKRIDANNTLIIDSTRLNEISKVASEGGVSTDCAEILKKMEDMFPENTEKNKSVEVYTSEMAMIKNLKYLEPRIIEEYYEDLIIAFKMLQMYDAARKLIGQISGEAFITNDVRKKMSLQFLLVNVLFDSEEYLDVLSECDQVLAEEPLLDSEKINFMYIKAEALLALKKEREAEKVYQIIKKQNPHFRLVNIRLNKIEQNK